ncbi:MAG: hypothetical protein R3D00_17665 [Bacteroidia bacterium]
MNRYALIFCGVIFLLLTALLTGCKCDDPTNPECPNYCVDETNPECPNYNPCLDKKPVSAAFEIREAFYLGYPPDWETYDTDTVVTGLVEFYALEADAQYEWHIGSEVIRTRSVARSDFPPGNTTIRLKVTKKPDIMCFPDDDGVDSLARTFFQKTGCNSLLNGRYRGVISTAPLDTFEAIVNLCYSIDPIHPAFNIKPIIGGFEQACDTLFVVGNWAHRQLLIGENSIGQNNGFCNCMQGLMTLNPDNLDSLRFDFYWHPICQVNVGITKQFRGVRIHL